MPGGSTLLVDEPLELSLAASRCGLWLEQPCGGDATCGRCRVRVTDGFAPVSDADRQWLGADDIAAGWRLACQFTVVEACTIDVPPQDLGAPLKSFGPEQLAHVTSPPDVAAQPLVPGLAPCGVAVDLGSTTVAAAVVDLRDGRLLGTASCLNPQVQVGSDIMSRIHFARQRPDGNAQLHRMLVDAVGALISELSAREGLTPDRLVSLACAGNATMTHAAVGADVSSLGEAPYRGLFVAEQDRSAAAFGWPVHPEARVRFVPQIGSHVGGDTVAGILACDLDGQEGWRVLVDLGTNAEVVVGRRGRLVATSTAAGPAFDGASISCGVRAVRGAIDAVHVRPDGYMVTTTIADHAPIGLCGSGLVDAVAELLAVGVITPSGYMRSREESEAAGVPAALLDRLKDDPSGERLVRLAGSVSLSAHDVRQLQLAKGSISAGIALLMDHLGIGPHDLDEILVAGTFGTFVRKTSLMAIGLVPRIDAQRVHFVGNAAGAGVRMILADRTCRQRAIAIARNAEYVELAGDARYEVAFCEAVPFPSPPGP